MVQTVLNQTYSNWELLITDDCSTDGTFEVIKGYAERDSRIKIFRLKKNSGPGVARNNSISNSTGRFIAFCDSDDQWTSEKLATQVKFMLEKNCALSYTSYDIVNEEGIYESVVRAKQWVDYKTMLKNNYIGCLTAMYDTNLVGKIFMPDIRKRQDWALWLAILKKTDKACGINESLAKYRKRSDSMSVKKIDLVKYNWKVYNEIEEYSIVKSAFLMMQFFFYYISKKL